MRKCICSIVIIILFILSLSACSFDYNYNNGKTVDGIYYVFNKRNKTCFAAGYTWDGDEGNTKIAIPDECDGYKVTELGGFCGRGVPTPFAIYIPDSKPDCIAESGLPDDAVIQYRTFNIKLGKNVKEINCVAYYDRYIKTENSNYVKILVDFDVDADNKNFITNEYGKLLYSKYSTDKVDDFDYAADYDIARIQKSKFCKIIDGDDFTWNYYIFDINGKIVDSGSNVREPHIESAGDYLLKLSVQTGTGLSTRWSKYYDLKNGLQSQAYMYDIAHTEQYVADVNIIDNITCLSIKSIFDGQVKSIFKLDNASLNPDPVISAKFSDEGNSITVEYRTKDEKSSEMKAFSILID